jgi:glycine/D-amino acid oxidase-like deaminating enzyme
LPARALFLPREGALSSRRLHEAYDAVLAKCASAIDADVEAIDGDGSWRRLATSAGPLRARVVVIAAGARSHRLLEGLGLGRAIPRVLAGVGVALVLRAPPPRSVVRFVGGPYLVPWDDGRVYAGATNQLMEEGTTTPPASAAVSLRAELARYAGPELAAAEATETLVGWRPTTRDGLPLLGPTSVEGVWVATGTNRDGLHLSPLVAAELTRCLGTRELPFAGRFLPERAEPIASTS